MTETNNKDTGIDGLQGATAMLSPPIPLIPPSPLYTSQQISDYKAVLNRQMVVNAHKAGNDPEKDPEKLKEAKRWMSMSSGGTSGKSALLNRIASGLRPFVLPPPVSMSYPWYSVVEVDAPQELWLDAPSAEELLKLGERLSAWRIELEKAKGNALELSNVSKVHKVHKVHKREQAVPINQSLWKVVRQVGPNELHVTWAGWEELGFVWSLSIDQVSAAESSQCIVSWHNPALKRIATFEQLVLEQRWHINRRIDEMRAAIDPSLAEIMLEKAKKKDGETSRFYQTSVTQNMKAKRDMVKTRIQEGKPGLPTDEEIQEMVDHAVQRYLAPRCNSGSGWYSVDEEGSLVLHTWRIKRISPQVVPECIYLNSSALSREGPGWDS